MSIKLHLPESIILKPVIVVVGVGGAGGNAVNNMIVSKLEGASLVVANTDAQALENSKCDKRIQLGERITRGLGAGASPEIGRAAAEEAIDTITEHLAHSNMVFITAGMGGGTGTGAAPVIAKAARELGILTVGVVTKPFQFEGAHRMRMAEQGLIELQKFVDTLIVIPNQNLFRIANEKTTFADAFKMADNVLHDAVRSITDLMIMPGLINLDFADIKTVMSEMGKAMMGSGEATGENRSIVSAEAAISNPLLDHSSMKGARGVLINITGGPDMTLFEVDEAANRIRDEVDPEANIIFGSTFDPTLEGKIRVSVVATGIDGKQENKSMPQNIVRSQAELVLENPVIKVTEPEIKENNTDFARKNIPSYPNLRHQEINNLFTHQAKEEVENDYISCLKSDLAENESNDELPENKNALGLFGKMANSVKFSSENSLYNSEDKKASELEEAYEEADQCVTEDMIEIPAFLRRMKK